MGEIKRILLVTNTLGKWGETNGVEYTYNSLIPHFSTSEIKTDIVTYGLQENIEELGNVTLYTHKPKMSIKYDSELRIDLNPFFPSTDPGKHIFSTKYDLVHSATPDTLGVFAWRIALKNKCPRVGVYHTVVDDFARERGNEMFGNWAGSIAGHVTWRYLKWYYGQADVVLAPSKFIQDNLAGKLKTTVGLMDRGIDTDKFDPSYRTSVDDIVRILYVGRVAQEKNLDMLIEINRELQNRIIKYRNHLPKYKFVVVGHGIYLNKLRKKFPQAEFTGKLTGVPLYQAFANGDIFVFPSRTDTFGNVVRQAMSSGLPALVTDSMGPKEQIEHGVTGYVADTPEEMADAILRLLEDTEHRIEMGDKAREYAVQFTWAKVFESLLEKYSFAYKKIHGIDSGVNEVAFCAT